MSLTSCSLIKIGWRVCMHERGSPLLWPYLHVMRHEDTLSHMVLGPVLVRSRHFIDAHPLCRRAVQTANGSLNTSELVVS